MRTLNILKKIKNFNKKHFVEYNEETKKYYVTNKVQGSIDKINSKPFKITKFDTDIYTKYFDEYGKTTKENIEKILKKESNINEVEKKSKYLLYRIEKQISENYTVENADGSYSITEKGKNETDKIVNPNRHIILEKINYWENLGLLTKNSNGFYRIENKLIKNLKNKKVPMLLKSYPKMAEYFKACHLNHC